jgi:hypothetical protein
MGEQIEARAGIEIGEPVPQRLVVGGNVIAPAFVPLGDLVRRRAVLQLLGWAEKKMWRTLASRQPVGAGAGRCR